MIPVGQCCHLNASRKICWFQFLVLPQLITTSGVGRSGGVAMSWLRQGSSLTAWGYLETQISCWTLLSGLELGISSQDCKGAVDWITQVSRIWVSLPVCPQK